MFVSEDGVPYGSIDVSKLDQIKAKTDEARAAVDALKPDQEQAARDAERASQGERALGINSTGRDDDVSAEDRAKARDAQQKDAQRQEAAAAQRAEVQEAELQQLQAQAEQSGVTVDKRWGADRLRQEITSAQSAKQKKG